MIYKYPDWLHNDDYMHPSLNVRDFKLLNEISHHGSMRSLARSMGIKPQHLSKLVSSLEDKCGAKLLSRSPKGISLTPEAVRFSALAEKVLQDLQSFSVEIPAEAKKTAKPFSLVSRVFMNVCFSPVFSRLVEQEFPSARMRFIDASPKKKEEWAREGIVDFVLSLGNLDLGRSWQEEEIGQIEWSFYARAGHPLGRSPKKEALVQYPLVAHAHIDGKRLVEQPASHPYKLKFRYIGNATETALSSMRILERTDNVAFMPDILVRELMPSALLKLSVSGLEPFRQSVFLHAHKDRVPMLLYRRMLLEGKSVLAG